jgi:hypothetical protein
MRPRAIIHVDTFGTAGVTKLVTERGGFGGTSPEPLRYACGNELQEI